MNIVTEINIGDRVFFLKKITEADCPFCNGTGKIYLDKEITFNADTIEEAMKHLIQPLVKQVIKCIDSGFVREYSCPICFGSGRVNTVEQKKYEILAGNVVSMHIDILGDGVPVEVMYRVVDEHETIYRLSSTEIYTNRADAEKQCSILNIERKEVCLDDIRVPDSFSNAIPCNEKINKRLDEWRKNRKFETEIYVDNDMNLSDGYTSYLVYKMMGVKYVPVVVRPNITNNKE